MCPASSRSPTSTATRAVASAAAQFQHEGGQERHPQRGHGGLAVLAGDAPDLSACGLARPNSLSVGSPSTTSRKWPPSRASSRHCRWVTRLGVQPDQDGEDRDQRQRDADDQTGDPVGHPDPDQHGDRHHAASTSWGR